MMIVLDTSALLAFYFGEPGEGRVGALLGDAGARVCISALTVGEFWSRFRSRGVEARFDEEWGRVRELLGEIIPVSAEIVLISCALRSATRERLPYIDALIAATAVVRGATLAHRDAHFESIPAGLLRQTRVDA